jgi:peptidoglycan hydrolase CwlO-like protein
MPNKKAEKVEQPKGAKQSIFDWSKKRIEHDVAKLNKVVAKFERSILNHEKELNDKKEALEDCKAEIKQLVELLKQT